MSNASLPDWFVCVLVALAFGQGFMCGGYVGATTENDRVKAFFAASLSWLQPAADAVIARIRRRR